eukprot:CAMPEP_0116042094 /NCGR_PEP_ID=MMETSP0321-20121206/25482_1 /TAXON_ID=163516 /ORGANISM="Leptocylindrus danicus var. danicus, Strain B650" /LENGTH=88 /DNA_ID=CAMNT_0003522499 /DNA_START=209 /DNA_END=475 /DNA_ORIENTATION=+
MTTETSDASIDPTPLLHDDEAHHHSTVRYYYSSTAATSDRSLGDGSTYASANNSVSSSVQEQDSLPWWAKKDRPWNRYGMTFFERIEE